MKTGTAKIKVDSPGRSGLGGKKADHGASVQPVALQQTAGNQAVQSMHSLLQARRPGSGPYLHQGPQADRALAALGALGAAVGQNILLARNLSGTARSEVLRHELRHTAQTGDRDADPAAPLRLGTRHDRWERAAAGHGPPGTGADPQVVRLFYDERELLGTSITPSWAESLTDQDLQQARTTLAERVAEFPVGSAEHYSAQTNDAVLAAEIERRGGNEYQRNTTSEFMAGRPQGPPVVFGIDNETRRIFTSVAGNGATLEEISLYLYGSTSFVDRLAEENGLAPGEIIPPGRTIRSVEGRPAEPALDALNNGLREGAIIRTDGIPEGMGDDSGMVYTVPLNGTQATLTAAQFNGLLEGMRRKTGLEIDRIQSMFQILLETRNDHESGTNWAVRGVSDWMGDVDLPGPMMYIIPIAGLKALRTQLDNLQFSGTPPENAAALQEIQSNLLVYGRRLERAEASWDAYIEGTIEGASKAAHRAEIVRNVSFGAVAGMAGAVAAPAAFAALGTAGVTGGTATVLSLGAATGTGAMVRGGLEVAAPGVTVQTGPNGETIVREDQRSSGERFGAGAYSGAVQGLTGGAGAFLAPAVSAGVSGQLATRFGQGFVQSGSGQLTSQVVTGTILGAPSGALGSGLETLPAYMRGDITGEQYLGGIGQGGFYGGVFGGVFSAVPVNGFYRSGLMGARGAPVMPRWMMAGPYSSLANMRGAQPGFHTLPREQLPAFIDDPGVAGYAWTRVRSGGVDEWAPVRMYGPRQEFELAWYDTPDAGAAANRALLYGASGTPRGQLRAVGTRTTQRPRGGGYAGMAENTPVQGMPRSTRRDFPMSRQDYRMQGETLPDGSQPAMVRGHRTDYRDTSNRTAQILDSNLDPANFTPEPQAWGSGRPRRGFEGRVQLTNRMLRENSAGGTQYGQYEYYGTGSRVTNDGTPIPEAILFVEFGPNGAPARAWRINYSDPNVQTGVNMNTAANIDLQYGVNPASVPQAVEIPVSSLPPGLFGVSAAAQSSMPTSGLEE